MLSFDLAAEANELRREKPWRAGGHNARTLVKYLDLRIVLVDLDESVDRVIMVLPYHHSDSV